MSRALTDNTSNCYTEAQAEILRAHLERFGRFFRKRVVKGLRSCCAFSYKPEKSPFLAFFDSALRVTLEAPMRKDELLPQRPEYLIVYKDTYTPLFHPNLLTALEFIFASFLHDRAKAIFGTGASRESSSANAGGSMTTRLDNKRPRPSDNDSWSSYLSEEDKKLARDWIINARYVHRERSCRAMIRSHRMKTSGEVVLCLKAMGPNHVLQAGRYHVIDLGRHFLPIPFAEWEEIGEYISEEQSYGRAVTFQFRGFTLLAGTCKVGVLEVGKVDTRITRSVFVVPEDFMVLSDPNGFKGKGDCLDFPVETTASYEDGKWTFKNKQATFTIEPVLE